MPAAKSKTKTPASASKAPSSVPAPALPASATKSAKGGKTAAKKAGKKKGARKKVKHRYTAATADKYELYQKAVQSPDVDVEFLTRIFKETRGREALHLREDFCGTGLLSSWWIKQSDRHTAEGFDIDPEPVSWGLEHNFEKLGEASKRYTVHLKDVREEGLRRPDLRIAQNFSYCIFLERDQLLDYFRIARDSLADDGMFVIDMHGGSEATEEMEEEKKCGGFTYVWDQDEFWPGTGEYQCYIHFRFPDGTEMTNAFEYPWRMWYLTELKDIMLDAGFERVDLYFEGTDEDGESGDGEFTKGEKGENCLSYISYLAGIK